MVNVRGEFEAKYMNTHKHSYQLEVTLKIDLVMLEALDTQQVAYTMLNQETFFVEVIGIIRILLDTFSMLLVITATH